jgi:hypothetical protein
MNQYRQGHILLNPAAIPAAAHRIKPARENHVVLATGESGREHVFRSPLVDIFQVGPSLFIEVKGDGAVLHHEEHGDIEVEPGTYEVLEQQEADDDEIGFGGTRRSFD